MTYSSNTPMGIFDVVIFYLSCQNLLFVDPLVRAVKFQRRVELQKIVELDSVGRQYSGMAAHSNFGAISDVNGSFLFPCLCVSACNYV